MYPAAEASGLLYWKRAPKSVVGFMVASTSSWPCGDERSNVKSHSKSWRGRPVHAHTRCFRRTRLVTSGSPTLNDG